MPDTMTRKPRPQRAVSKSRPAPPSDDEDEGSDDAIYERIWGAIARKELPPGTRLREDQLRSVFGVSRARIRSVLARLAFGGVVLLEPNRGASVMTFSPAEARDNFIARRAIEGALVRVAAGAAEPAQIAQLSRHVKLEEEAIAKGDASASVWLSGEFHHLIAEFSGIKVMQKFLRELITRESLIILTYERPGRPSCSCTEHRQILDALVARDAERAARLMDQHLLKVEERLDLEGSREQNLDLAAILSRPARTR